MDNPIIYFAQTVDEYRDILVGQTSRGLVLLSAERTGPMITMTFGTREERAQQRAAVLQKQAAERREVG